MNDGIMNRQKGEQLPISIGTALAFEKALAEDVPPEFLVNGMTLFRNVYDAISAEERSTVSPDDYLNAITEEVQMLHDAMVQLHGEQSNARLYLNSYKSLGKHLPHAKLKVPTTANQQRYAELSSIIFKKLAGRFNPLMIDTGFKAGRRDPTVIFTHEPTDLLSSRRFKQLTLLESYTGELKGHSLWYTKLGKGAPTVPLNGFTLSIYGDGNNHLRMLHKKVKDVVTKMAKDNRWTPLTTYDKAAFNIKRLDPLSQQFLLEVLKSWRY